jgi:hypothetical protein
VIQNHVPDSHKRNAPQESLEVCPITKYKSRVYLPVVAINKRQTNEASTKDLIMKGKPVITTYVYIIDTCFKSKHEPEPVRKLVCF